MHPDGSVTRSTRSAADGSTADDGSSPIASVFAVAIFLGLLLLSSQVLVHLYATSIVTAVAFDTARQASGAGGGCAAVLPDARARLGAWGRSEDVAVSCRTDASGDTEVRILGPSPARALAIFGPAVTRDLDRGAVFRTERAPDGSS